MFAKIKGFYSKNKEIILYLVFGVCTTAVDWIIRFIFLKDNMAKPLVHTVDAAAWLLAVAFAYVTNRIFVFQSRTKGLGKIVFEILKFAGSRVASFLIQEVIVFFVYDYLPPKLVVISTSVIVVILNYIFSKLIVFRKGKKSDE